jgi:hypothetical protein
VTELIVAPSGIVLVSNERTATYCRLRLSSPIETA